MAPIKRRNREREILKYFVLSLTRASGRVADVPYKLTIIIIIGIITIQRAPCSTMRMR